MDAKEVKRLAVGRWPEVFRVHGNKQVNDAVSEALRRPNRHVTCPFAEHDDENPSFRFSDIESGRWICTCADRGGDALEVLQRTNGWSFGETVRRVGECLGLSNGSPNGYPPKKAKPPRHFYQAKEALRVQDRRIKGQRVGMWRYDNESGKPYAVVVRYNLPTPEGEKQKKTFRPIGKRPEGWVLGDPPQWFPYRLPELEASDRIYICEGEKAADAVAKLGLVATTSAHGAESPHLTDWTAVAGKQCVILPDEDDPGRKYAENVAGILGGLDPPATVKTVQLPDLPHEGDAFDYVQRRESEGANLDQVRSEIERLAEHTDDVAPEVDDDEWKPSLLSMSNVEPREVDWLWKNRIPAGRLSLLVGVPGAGKSFLTCDLASRISTGTPWPDGSECRRGSVLFITAEDDPHDTIRPRLDAHRADVSRIHLLSGLHRRERGKRKELMFTLKEIDALEWALRGLSDCLLVIIDPVGSFLGGKTDSHRDNEVRSVLAPVGKLAEKYGPAVLVVAHRRKPGKAGAYLADDTALGSRAFTGITRAVWHLSQDTGDDCRRFFLPGKCNLSAKQPGLAFAISGEPASVHWERDPVDMTADEALRMETEAGKRQDNGRKLIEFIDGKGGRVVSRDVIAGCRWISNKTEAEAALQELVDAGHGKWEVVPPGSKGGRATHVYVHVSSVSTSTTLENPEDYGGSADADNTYTPPAEPDQEVW